MRGEDGELQIYMKKKKKEKREKTNNLAQRRSRGSRKKLYS